MPSIVKKKIKGHTYYYAVKTAWVDGRSRVVWQKYLGKADDIVARLSGDTDSPYTAKVSVFGSVYALYSIARRLGVVEIVDRFAAKRNQGLSVGQYMLIAAINRAVCPTSKRQIAGWYESTSLNRWLSAKPSHLSSQRFWDHMGYLDAEAIRKIETELTKAIVKEFGIDLRVLVYDTTNFFTWIDTLTEAEIPQRGHNKQKRNDLRQVGLALMVTMDFAVPLFHEAYRGNRPEVKEFGSVVEDLIARYKALAGECLDITLILDKGNNSKKNVVYLSQAVGFVGSLVPSHHEDLLSVPAEEFSRLDGPEFGGVSALRTEKKVFGSSYTVVVTYNAALYLGQMQGLILSMRKANQALRELKKRLDVRRANGKTRGRAPTRSSVEAQVKKILRSPLDKIIACEVKEDGGHVVLDYQVDHEAENGYIEKHFGKHILFTNRHDWTTEDIARAYRGQARIEGAFRTMKNYDFIGWSPMYHWTDQKIRVHAFYCVLALTLTSLLRRDLFKAGVDMSIPAILEELSQIYEVAHIYPPTARKKDHFTLSQMNETQKTLARALNLEEQYQTTS